MRIRTISGLLGFLLLIATPAFAVKTILYYENECCRNITEGEFAILYCQGLKLREPAQGWTVQTAAAALSSLGHQPEGGWVLSRFLSEAVASRLLRNSPFYRKPFTEPATQNSDLLITIARARSTVPSDEGITQGEFAVMLASALKLPVPPGCRPDQAIDMLGSLPTPIKPVLGWKVDAPLNESDMVQILVPTPFHPANIDPRMEIASIQAYSLLFGKYEIATQGHFGLFMVDALGVPPPAGGWTKRKALDYIQSEFGVTADYGWNPNTPLCAETFESALRQILVKVQQGSTSRPPSKGNPISSSREKQVTGGPFVAGEGEMIPDVEASYDPAGQNPSEPSVSKEVEAFIKEVRRSGMIPADRCTTVPVQGLNKLPSFSGCIGCNRVEPVSTITP